MEGVNILENDYANMHDGVMVEIKGKKIAMVRWVRDMKPADDAPLRADGTPARGYSHFTVGGRGFTIDDQSPDDIAMLKDRVQKKNIASIILETSSYQKPELDENKNVIPDEFTKVNSFRFVSIITAEDAKAYAKTEGEVAQEEAKWAPKPVNAGGVTMDAVNKAIVTNLSSLLPGLLKTALAPAQAAAPAPAEAVPAGVGG